MLFSTVAGLGLARTEVPRRFWGNSFFFRSVTVKCIQKDLYLSTQEQVGFKAKLRRYLLQQKNRLLV